MDIFHIIMLYLCYFILFCMFDDRWWFDCRSFESAGESTVKILNFCNSKNSVKIQRILFLQQTSGARRATGVGPQGDQTPPRHGPNHGRAWAPPGGPVSPPVPPLSRIWPIWPKNHRGRFKEIFRHRIGGENHRERKNSPAGRNLLGKFLPREGRSSPSSLSWDSSGSSSTPSSPTKPSSPQLHSISLLHLGLYLL